MKKVMKHGLIHYTIILALAVTLLAGCSSSNNGNSKVVGNEGATSSPSPTATENNEAAELQPYEVSIYYPGDAQKDVNLVEEELNLYLKDKINATVKLHALGWGDYQQRTELMMQSGEKMDLVFAPSWFQFFENTNKGAFVPLNDDNEEAGNLLEKYGQGIKEHINSMFLEAPVVDGKLYAIPTNKEIAQGSGYFYRKDIVDKYNIPYEQINSHEDLTPWLDHIMQNEPDMYPVFGTEGFGADWGNEAQYLNGYSNFNVPYTYFNYTNDEYKIYPLWDPQIFDNYMKHQETMYDWFQKDYYNKDVATTKVNKDDLRKVGKLWWEMHVTKPGDINEMRLKNESGSGPEYFEYYKHQILKPLVTTDAATGSQIAISRNSKDPARAMMVLNLMHSDKTVINLITFGIEGKHYTKIGDNRIEKIPNSGYDPGTFWILGSQMLNYLYGDQPDDLYDEMKQFNDNAQKANVLGFRFDPAPVQNEMSQINNTVVKYSRMMPAVDPKVALPKLVDELKAAGLEKVVVEAQSQLDAWLTANGKK